MTGNDEIEVPVSDVAPALAGEGRPRPLATLTSLRGSAATLGKHPELLVRQAEPFNAGPPLSRLCQATLTPADLFYVRSHGNVPVIDEDGHVLEIGRAGEAPVRLTLAELKAALPPVTVPATLQCAGNRRQELMAARPIAGELDWGAEAIGHAEWTGVRLRDVFDYAGVRPAPGDQHVAMSGLDETERLGQRFTFGGSIPLAKALSPEVILAHTMNGQPLLPAHGFPLRAVVPGYIGARSVKWLKRLTLQAPPSDNYFQARAYRLFAPQVNADNVVWDAGRMLGETAVTAVIGEVAQHAGQPGARVAVRGYAAASAGRQLVRVELSTDGGRTWLGTALTGAAEPWAWQLWRAEVLLAAGQHQLVVRAQDDGGHTQPRELLQVWNFKGYMNNAWHRVELAVGA